jgi:S-formylglutathione hydrolase FrmB
MSERTRTTYLVTADHVVAKYACRDLPVVVTDDGEYGFYANARGYGCSKNYKTAETAIRSLFADHACTNVRIIKA